MVALADAWADGNDTARADHYYTRIRRELGGSAYSVREDQWFETRTPPARPWTCTGCH